MLKLAAIQLQQHLLVDIIFQASLGLKGKVYFLITAAVYVGWELLV